MEFESTRACPKIVTGRLPLWEARRASRKRPIVAVAGTVDGGSTGTVVQLPPADEFCIGCARQNQAQHQNKRK